MNNKKNKHLTFDDRQFIENALTCGMCFKHIAAKLGKDQTTISKEVKAHMIFTGDNVKKNSEGQTFSCPLLSKPPYVCNACSKRSTFCGHQKQKYYAKQSHDSYTQTLSLSRQGVALNKQVFYDDDLIVSQKLASGQHLFHIACTNKLHCSISSLYRYFNKGYLSASSIDLPRKVKFSARKKSNNDEPYVSKKLKMGRSYEDFTNFISNNNIQSWVEMDTVIGQVGGNVILTLDFTFCNFIFGFLLKNKSSAEVATKIISLKHKLIKNNLTFGEVFPVILTDNGGEFSNISAIEKDDCGNKETNLFFCDPYCSYQKPHVENTHILLRDILPKGRTFNDLTQEKLNIIFSHINSIKKKSLNGKSAYELFTFMYTEKLASILGITKIDSDMVKQDKKLLKEI